MFFFSVPALDDSHVAGPTHSTPTMLGTTCVILRRRLQLPSSAFVKNLMPFNLAWEKEDEPVEIHLAHIDR